MGLHARAVAAVAAAGIGLGGLRASADDAELKKQVDALQKQVEDLQAKSGGAALPAGVGGPMGEDVKMSGYLDVGYIWNSNRPATKTSAGRVFESTGSNEFIPHALEIDLEKACGDPKTFGFRADVAYGRDPQLYRSGGSSVGTTALDGSDMIDLQQAYVTYQATKELQLRAGKYVTLAGAEVIESRDNWNYSRSFMFGYSIPFTHTGIRGSYTASETVTLHAGVCNGWDVIKDNNDGKTIEIGAGVGITKTDTFELSYSGAIYYGPEQTTTALGTSPGAKRLIFSNVLSAPKLPVENLELMLNIDIGSEESLVPSATDLDDGDWNAFALYGRYTINPTWLLAARIEQFNDNDGIRALTPLAPGVTENDLFGVTVTLQHKPADNVLARLELRFDNSDEDFFLDGKDPDDGQTTFGAEVIYSF